MQSKQCPVPKISSLSEMSVYLTELNHLPILTCILFFTSYLSNYPFPCIYTQQKNTHHYDFPINSPLQQSVRIHIPLHFSFQHHLIKFSRFIPEVVSLICCNCFLGCLFKIMLSEQITNLHLQLIILFWEEIFILCNS